ncbi:MAG: thiol reductant ABC exporter subunit CydD [Streptococcaceae bacterium]|nr:thiol reductant ABC exporter subunit CydD [Streptococcaceae bacterium]
MIDQELMKLPGVRAKMPLLGFLAVAQALVILGQALFLSGAVVHLWQGHSLASDWKLIVGFFLCFLGRQVVATGRSKMLDDFAYTLATDLRRDLLSQLYELGPAAVSVIGTGSAATTAIAGIDQVETYVKLVLSKMLNMMIVPVLLLIPIFFLDWQSGIVLILAFPFAVLFMILLGYTARNRAERQYESYQLLSNHFLDSLRGLATLRYFGRSKAYAGSIYRTSERFRRATMSTLSMAMLNNFALDFFATLSVATVAMFLGLRLMGGSILLYPALAALILAPEYFLPLREFASDYHATLNGKNALAAVLEVLRAEKTENKENTKEIQWNEASTLDLTNLSKTYEGGRGVTLPSAAFTGFEKVAIIGSSGAGKSTLLNLLAGFITPDSGTIEVNNQAISEMNWSSAISFIPQSAYIFSASLRDNLAFYNPEANDTAVLQAAKVAGLDELVDEIGLDTLIGPSGRTLSGGQAQRVALARAFLANDRNILLLDEPTAHLDIETELEIKENILPLFAHKLVFLATHRLHWLNQMDKVIVLNNGQFEAIGSPAELAATNTYYQQLTQEMRGQA